MEAGTHISIPLKYDLLLNQEIVLLNEIKKFSKNELIKCISKTYFFNPTLSSEFVQQIKEILGGCTYDDLAKDWVKSKDNKYNVQRYAIDTFLKFVKKRNEIVYVNKMKDAFEKFILEDFYKEQNNIPKVDGKTRIYVRLPKDTLNNINDKLAKYFSYPFEMRTMQLFICNNMESNKLFLESQNKSLSSNQDKDRDVSLVKYNGASSKYEYTYYRITENNKTIIKNLNNIKCKPKNTQKDEIHEKEIIVNDKTAFSECLSYFINKIFLVKQKENIYTIAGTEKDIYYFEKMIK